MIYNRAIYIKVYVSNATSILIVVKNIIVHFVKEYVDLCNGGGYFDNYCIDLCNGGGYFDNYCIDLYNGGGYCFDSSNLLIFVRLELMT